MIFPATAVGLVRHGMRLTATPNDVVFYRPFETYERSLRDALLVEETAAELIARAIQGPVPASGRRPATRRGRNELVDGAKDVLLARLAEPLSLGTLADELKVSPFHLTRTSAPLSARRSTRSRSSSSPRPGCVYELAIVEFERRAWIEDVIGNPDGPDLDRYFARRFGGPGLNAYALNVQVQLFTCSSLLQTSNFIALFGTP